MMPRKGQQKVGKGRGKKSPPPAPEEGQEKVEDTPPDTTAIPDLSAEAKTARIAAIVESNNKRFGKGALGTLGASFGVHRNVIDVIDTGSIGLNHAIGVGGYPRGCIIEIYGAESAGKTTLALHAIANAQRIGGIAALIDAEHALDVKYAQALGVNTDELLLSQPDSGEEGLQIAASLVDQGVALIVVDSVAALVPQAELDGEIGDSKPGAQARLMGQAMRILAGKIGRSGCCMIFTNQIRYKIGVMFGNPRTTPGGEALKFYASLRLEITAIGALKRTTGGSTGEDDEAGTYGKRTRVVVRKNKVSAPYRQAEMDIIFGKGISWSGELLDMATAKGLIKSAGAWYNYGDKPIGHGRHNAIAFFEENPDFVTEIRERLK